MVKNFFLMSHLNLPSFSLRPFPLVLSLHPLVKSPSPSFLSAPPGGVIVYQVSMVAGGLEPDDLSGPFQPKPCYDSVDVASEFYEDTYRPASLSTARLIAFAREFLLRENWGVRGISTIQDHLLNLQAGKHVNL